MFRDVQTSGVSEKNADTAMCPSSSRAWSTPQRNLNLSAASCLPQGLLFRSSGLRNKER